MGLTSDVLGNIKEKVNRVDEGDRCDVFRAWIRTTCWLISDGGKFSKSFWRQCISCPESILAVHATATRLTVAFLYMLDHLESTPILLRMEFLFIPVVRACPIAPI
jgi:hypothetical protein